MILDRICKSIVTEQKNNNNWKTPHQFINIIISNHTTVCSWVTRHVINKDLRQYKARVIPTREDCNVDTVAFVESKYQRTKTILYPNIDQKKGGRPKNATNGA